MSGPEPRGPVDAAPVQPEASDDLTAEWSSRRRPRRRRRDDSVASFLRELPVLVLVAFLLAFVLRTFVVQVFYIPSSSMEPTLLVDDRILVDKVTYRLRDPQHGEIVVFEGHQFAVPTEDRDPVSTVVRGIGQLVGLAPANARDYVKRVIGLPGDEIRIDDGRVAVNGVWLPEPYAVDDPRSCEPIIVPEGKLFFLGDNRPNSSDSRYATLGFVDRDAVVGKAFTVIWPPDRIRFLRSPRYPDVPPASRSAPQATEPVTVGPCSTY
ncbi:MAG: signal peptidase I [Actinomycetota bacterium]|nr:signal peptidase I [Actinomycetota bacterium]